MAGDYNQDGIQKWVNDFDSCWVYEIFDFLTQCEKYLIDRLRMGAYLFTALSTLIRFDKEDIMQEDEQEDKTIYKVVVNHEEQYSIWPVDRENALGWTDEGKSGTKEECLAHIKKVWTDMRPLSLRKKMEKMAQNKDVD